MVIKTDKIKYGNLKLLVVLYVLFLTSFSLVIKDLYVFLKASETAGLVYDFSFLKFCFGSLIVLANIFVLSSVKLKDMLYAVLVLVLVFFVFPSAVLFINVDGVDMRIFLSQNIFFWSILLIGKIKIKFSSKKTSLRSSKNLLLVVVLVGIVPFVVLYLPYINLNNLLLREVYETRAIMASNISNLYTDYTYSWFSKLIIPSLLVFGLFRKNKTTVFLGISSLIFLYLCGANKAVFAGLIMVLVLYRFDYRKKMNYLLLFLIGVTLLSLFSSLVFKNNDLMVLTVRRPFLLPGLLDLLYFDFFDGNNLFWSESITGSFIEYPYDKPHSYIVGEEYFGKAEWNANNGIISDGFMNFGMIGVTINAVIVGLYFSTLNQLNISGKFFGLIFLFIFSLISSSLTTVLLTHGGFVLLLLAIFVLKDTRKQML
ncbi:hypothetical protein FEE95_05825 [Maribacter algarum]|uniref:Oligosaccharide repeat unit polymerase n=1 Tax=Maribacter algarum (ex Zhang et al. 2020) TaxID=2578118 RepID=A0A5S3PVI4_9FLAO|nr:hypothetical protein [Maribacter algarum]TMM58950.1 hypothetical protein FEE95_05825 [Maribacter algarum]